MIDLDAVRRLKSSLSSITIALAKTRARENELIAKRGQLWRDAEAQGLANRAALAKFSGVDAMIVSRELNKEKTDGA
jgi:hypothetical protein